jgi:hypothetical protein
MRPQPGSQAERRAVQDLVARLDAQDAVPVAEMGALPDGPGIFLLRDAKGTVLHVGHSVDGPWSVEARRMAKAGQHVAALAISDRRITLLAWHLAVGHLLPVQLG